MPTNIQTIKNFPALIKYLRTDLGWPVDEEQADSLTFDYDPEELGLDKDSAVKVRARAVRTTASVARSCSAPAPTAGSTRSASRKARVGDRGRVTSLATRSTPSAVSSASGTEASARWWRSWFSRNRAAIWIGTANDKNATYVPVETAPNGTLVPGPR